MNTIYLNGPRPKGTGFYGNEFIRKQWWKGRKQGYNEGVIDLCKVLNINPYNITIKESMCMDRNEKEQHLEELLKNTREYLLQFPEEDWFEIARYEDGHKELWW